MHSSVRTVNHEGVTACAFGTDEATFYTGGQEGTVRAWRVDTGECLLEWAAHDQQVEALAAVAPGQIVSGGADTTVKHWNSNSGERLGVFQGHSDLVTSLAVGRDSESVVSGGYDTAVHLWRVSDPSASIAVQQLEKKVVDVAIAPGGPVAAFGGVGQHAAVWELESNSIRSQLPGHEYAVMSLAFLEDGRMLVTTDHSGAVRLWDTQTGTCRKTLTIETPGDYPVWAAGSTIYVGTEHGVSVFTSDGERRSVLDIDSGVAELAGSPGGAYLLVATHEGSLVVFDRPA